MSDLPFGFSSSGDDDDRRKESDGPAGFDPSSMDPAALGQMFSQLGSMLSGMGAGMTGGGQGPVNYQVATNLARQQIGSFTPVLAKETGAVADAVRLADVWLDDATTLPSGVSQSVAWTPVQWLEETLPTWKGLCNPVAEQLARTWQDNLPAEAAQFAGPMMGMLTQMSGMAFGTQLGQGLGQLAKEVLTSTDIGLPLAAEGVAVLLPEAIAKFAEGLEQPAQEIIVFLAAREAAHVRLFTHVPWLRQRLLSTVEEYARGISVDFSGIADATSSIDPTELFSNPGKLEELIGSSASFEPTTTPEQKAALNRLETLLALIEGWVESVVGQALGDRIPSTGALTETMRRRRASGGPAEQTFATLVGLELRPRKVREASDLWRKLLDASDIATRDGVWAHPDLMPDGEDLDQPAAFIDRVIGGDTGALDDPIAELERTLAAERDDDTSGESDDPPKTP
ncbi:MULTISPECIES: zinc-dependent metalloprotease [unclassified Gordonia (in: high G+C Gram-positive bacteria)]|uniref:zinc-dependent metalloprotease n=1 Tax=unclassified Gordonia (in: high G+C Gram-positive bacteria) TaxID=2657482 RepID=UPI001F11813B|nr:zinc-dependent metalloprotease [Gordonia sp. ABSL49_1]MCH5645037.1 zinc-dependent metalloprotease [Gordonia sp. ABSL49_1]